GGSWCSGGVSVVVAAAGKWPAAAGFSGSAGVGCGGKWRWCWLVTGGGSEGHYGGGGYMRGVGCSVVAGVHYGVGMAVVVTRVAAAVGVVVVRQRPVVLLHVGNLVDRATRNNIWGSSKKLAGKIFPAAAAGRKWQPAGGG
nr:hypothetical protein [Tanacetum cinerariifolium]